LIDLHLHTSASDGEWTPAELVRRAHGAGLRVVSVTDHDTLAGLPEAAAAAASCGLELVPGIEITAVFDTTDVHLLGYFLEIPTALAAFLEAQRAERVARLRAIAARLAELGMTVALEPLLARATAQPGRAVGRPLLARALVEAGYAGSVQEAFDRWLGEHRPAYVPRRAAPPDQVVAVIRRARGLASLAHPGLLRRDDLVPALVEAGLGAIEVYHAEHDTATEAHYRAMARRYGLAVSGGSDCHGDSGHRAALGQVTLPEDDYRRLHARLERAAEESEP
jgi:predicted metal-dependent phosphoesterase TrpH